MLHLNRAAGTTRILGWKVIWGKGVGKVYLAFVGSRVPLPSRKSVRHLMRLPFVYEPTTDGLRMLEDAVRLPSVNT